MRAESRPGPSRIRWPSLSWTVLLAAVALGAAPAGVAAQESGCALEARGGAAFPATDEFSLETGLGLAAGAACPLAAGIRIGGGLAHDDLQRSQLLRIEATADYRVEALSSEATVLEVRAAAGTVRRSEAGDIVTAPLPPDFEPFTGLVDEAWAPAVGASVRLRGAATEAFTLVADLGWRTAWLDARRIAPEGSTPRSESVHWFPLTVGFAFGL